MMKFFHLLGLSVALSLLSLNTTLNALVSQKFYGWWGGGINYLQWVTVVEYTVSNSICRDGMGVLNV